jgi:replicative DNA helicase
MNDIPHNPDAERALLGSVLINPQVCNEIDLPIDAFFLHRHQFVWSAFRRLKDAGRAIDYLTVCEALESAGKLAEVGGDYLIALLNDVPTSLNADEYAGMVREQYTRRLLLNAANEIARLAYSHEQDSPVLLNNAQAAIQGVLTQSAAPDSFTDLVEVASDLYERASERLELARAGKPLSSQRIATGLHDVDALLKGGLRKGSLSLIAGRPGQGKSSWMQTVALHALELGKRVAFFSLEMPKDEVAARLLSATSGLDANLLSEGLLGDSDWQALILALEGVQRERVFISDTPSLTPAQLRAQAYQLMARHGIDLVMVDYLQLMESGGREQNRVEQVSVCSRALKRLAMELRLPVLAAAQLSRAVENRADKEPQLSDLRESGSLEQDADIVMFVTRSEAESNLARLKVAKHRGGPVGAAELYFDAVQTRFRSLKR